MLCSTKDTSLQIYWYMNYVPLSKNNSRHLKLRAGLISCPSFPKRRRAKFRGSCYAKHIKLQGEQSMTTQATPDIKSIFLQQQPVKMLIGGQWVEAASGKTFETMNPSTGEVLAQVTEGDSEDVNRAVAAARKAFESGPWPKLTPSQRGRLLLKLADLIEQNAEELAQLETLDNGKPIKCARG